ncbi:hypothetical protein UGMREWDR_CDS0126 [Aeromonas phage GomatiRiver_11]|nr:hypothetical protein OBDJBBDK_00117 [Aeromonas phage AhFM11]WKW84293.1 hypothetical protein UGMREWDR_CDS0126 [Aeromonas phage GomatiRiver_11]
MKEYIVLRDKNGESQLFSYDPRSNMYINKETNTPATLETLSDLGYSINMNKTHQNKERSLMSMISQRNFNPSRSWSAMEQESKPEPSKVVYKIEGSIAMNYESLIEAADTAKNARESKITVFKNENARYLAGVSGMKNAAAIIESISHGIEIGQTRKWKRESSSVSGGCSYVAHHGIFPVAAFQNVNDAVKFVQLLRAEHPKLAHVGYTKLNYSKLSLNDGERDYKTVKTWEDDFVEDLMINISLDPGYRLSISCPNQRVLLEELNNYNQIPEISRLELFIDYCRRTAPKAEK